MSGPVEDAPDSDSRPAPPTDDANGTHAVCSVCSGANSDCYCSDSTFIVSGALVSEVDLVELGNVTFTEFHRYCF